MEEGVLNLVLSASLLGDLHLILDQFYMSDARDLAVQ